MNACDIRLVFRANAKWLCAVRGAVRGYLDVLGIEREQQDEVVLAVDEACANAVRHACAGRPELAVELAMRSENGFAEIELRDEGAPAPRDRLEKRELAAPSPEELRPGGLGVQLMYQVFDEVIFEPGETQGNRVWMRFRLPREATDASGHNS